MTGEELMAIRHKLGMTQKQFARVLGLNGSANTIRKEIDAMEQGWRDIWPRTAAIARALVADPLGEV